MIVPVPAHDVKHVWEESKAHIELALTQFDTGWGPTDILEKILTRDAQLWVIPGRASVVTQIEVYPAHKVLLVLLVGGEGVTDWFEEMMDTLEEFGRSMGCKYVDAHGRPGWERVGKSRGYEKALVIVRKKLDG